MERVIETADGKVVTSEMVDGRESKRTYTEKEWEVRRKQGDTTLGKAPVATDGSPTEPKAEKKSRKAAKSKE